ncbi:MAG: M1 family metallopeptidase [Actinomycetota bacterium]|nr:M1 family metallopeptidase [Actinomycetota bacterium]
MRDDRYRLPRTVVPSRYELTLEPDLQAATFSGQVSISVDVLAPVDEVVLNALELEIEEAWIEDDGRRVKVTPSFETETERCRLALERRVEPGRWKLNAHFTGVLNDKLVGFYRSTFEDESGTEHLIATTQMEATHARQAFPCWDEPEFKATFAVTLIVPQELMALSNGLEVSNEITGDGRRKVTFAETMKMPTYLVAFVVGPLEATGEVDVRGTPLRVVYPPGKGHLTDFALESGAFALRYFHDYYGIPYPGGKLDLVAIPDFAFGAMENLGCITFRETALLVDPPRAPQPDLQRVADVIHHEIAHMWFGDLVTMRWWNGIWLNEAFATFMEMKCTDSFRREWERWVDFGISRTAAFDVDSLESTRPIEFEVVSPKDAEGMFDILTYEKGAAVLRMLEQFLGEDDFRDGVRRYLSTHAFANTETTDLWDRIEEATGKPVRRIMDSWIFQGGYPILRAELVESGGKPALALKQERFRYLEQPPGQGSGERWAVPVLLRYGMADDERVESVLLEGEQERFELAYSPEWVVANAGATGFYRVGYSPELLAKLGHVARKYLTALERYQLVDDSFASVLKGSSSAAGFLEFAQTFGEETDLSVWQRLAAALVALDRVVEDRGRPALQKRVRDLFRPVLTRLGWEPEAGESERVRQLRGTALEMLGTLGADEEIIARARELHQRYLADPESVDPAVAAAAINIAGENGGQEEFDLYWRRHKELENPQLSIRYLHALARFRSPELVARMLDLAVSEVRTQDAPYLLGRALANRTRGPQVWEFVSRNWDAVSEGFPANSIVRMVDGVRAFTDRSLSERVHAFFDEHPVPQGEKTLKQILERLRVNVAFRERESERLAEALTRHPL